MRENRIFLGTSICLFVGAFVWADSQNLPQVLPPHFSLTTQTQYEEIAQSVQSEMDPETLELLKPYSYLFVPGFLGDFVEKMQNKIGVLSPLSAGFQAGGNYFGDEIEWMNSVQLNSDLASISSEQSPQVNAVPIRNWLRSLPQGQKAVLIGHSKGGLDLLEALIEEPKLQSRVRAIVMIQSPLYGSPVADSILKSAIERPISRAFLVNYLHGSLDSLKSLSVETRMEYMKAHEREIADLRETVPILSVATKIDPQSSASDDTALLLYRNEMLMNDEQNDGLVPWKRAIYPGAPFVFLDKLDHAVTVFHVGNLPFDRKAFFRSVLKMSIQLKPVLE